MYNIFSCIDSTVNKSAIYQFKNFLQRYPYVTKWFLCSDYCIEDINKPNDVISFVLYPYIWDFDKWNEVVSSMQKTDLKHCRQISPFFVSSLSRDISLVLTLLLEKIVFYKK